MQVREYFVKTGVFQILASHRSGPNGSARPSVSATTAGPAVSAGSLQAPPGRPSASSSPPQDPAQYAIRMHDGTCAGRRGGLDDAPGSKPVRNVTLDSESQRRLQLAAGAFRDPSKGTVIQPGMFSAPPGASGTTADGGAADMAPQQALQPMNALLHAIDVVQESDSPGNPGVRDGGAGGMLSRPGAADAAPLGAGSDGMFSSGQLRDAAALLLSNSGDGVAASASLSAALQAASASPAPQLMPDMQQVLAGALRAQWAAVSPAPWAYGGTGAAAGPGPAPVGMDALALQHWWATAGGLPGTGAPAGVVLREVQNMFGDAQPAPKEER